MMGGHGSQGPMKHVMLSFKQFLAQQDDSIDEAEAISAYNEYKAEFKRKQMEEFFEQHKEEDWWASKATNLTEFVSVWSVAKFFNLSIIIGIEYFLCSSEISWPENFAVVYVAT